MTLPDDTRIAGTKTVADWKSIRVRLDGDNNQAVWRDAFNDFFLARLDSRYFKPIEALGSMKLFDGEGFSIVTLHCSLIEFLASTVDGRTYRYSRNGVPPLGKFEYSNSSDLFSQFLQIQVPFKDMFANDKSAKEFYASVRCGLLHEARTKGNWLIKVTDLAEPAIDTEAKVIYRNKMQEAFEQFTTWYGEQLAIDVNLQQAFIRKFNSLCEP